MFLIILPPTLLPFTSIHYFFIFTTSLLPFLIFTSHFFSFSSCQLLLIHFSFYFPKCSRLTQHIVTPSISSLFILVPCFPFFSSSPSLCIFPWLRVAHCNFSKCLCNASGLYSNKFMTCNTCLSQSCLQVQEGAEKFSPTSRRLTSSHEMYMQFHLLTPQVNTFDIIFQVSLTLPLQILMLKYWKQEL